MGLLCLEKHKHPHTEVQLIQEVKVPKCSWGKTIEGGYRSTNPKNHRIMF